MAQVAGEKTSPASTEKTDSLARDALVSLTKYASQKSSSTTTTCTVENAARRREWGSLSGAERIAYTNAVKCLMSLPSQLDAVDAPGAKSRYDDFVAIHINQTLSIHGTANFLSWHRLFVWVYEQTLRAECNYQGHQPYWNWGKSAFDPLNSPIFDGSETSMSGNGAFAPHNCTNGLPTGLNCIPPGQGGGCVATGPFANMTVNLGSIGPTLDAAGVMPAASPLAHNPRCLRRDISAWVSSNWTTDRDSWDLITLTDNITAFQTLMQGDFARGFYGVHAAGHFTFGGDPGGDLWASPGDPAFYLHHAQIDRTWWIWQNYKSPESRTTAIGGTVTPNDTPPSQNGTIGDLLDLGILTAPLTIARVMSTVGLTGGPLCYVYE
ncbi:hypothetical protein QBC47DRAFT_429064 [Echria macrotheca]|uniref:Tyrosinase copper-binding domain-containing protein n=1 Tax=Echria macrotheca TaxID=438768 RepID=A0AAJ0BP52_9PEZI|nr:hypothetical protein QBC47DRAFT_429064 [Echria macrotheca]